MRRRPGRSLPQSSAPAAGSNAVVVAEAACGARTWDYCNMLILGEAEDG